jgi:hypothetical protein
MIATVAYTNPRVVDRQSCPDVACLANRSLSKDQDEFKFHQTVRSEPLDEFHGASQ